MRKSEGESQLATGVCRFCGQIFDSEVDVCNCPEARREHKVDELADEARERVEQLFGESAKDIGFRHLAKNGSIELLNNVVALIAEGAIRSATIQTNGVCKAKFNLTTKGKIKVARSETRSYGLEAENRRVFLYEDTGD